MTRDRLDHLFQHCADLGIDVEWDDLGSHRRGHYNWVDDKIVLSLRLTRAQATACLAHEVAHREFGDRCSTPAVERRAWELAAAMLVTPEQYAAAEEQVGPHASALALDLGVTPQVIEAWRRWWEKRGREIWRRRSGDLG